MVTPSHDHEHPVSVEGAVDSFDEPPRQQFKIPKAAKWLAGTAVGLVILAGGAGSIAR